MGYEWVGISVHDQKRRIVFRHICDRISLGDFILISSIPVIINIEAILKSRRFEFDLPRESAQYYITRADAEINPRGGNQ